MSGAFGRRSHFRVSVAGYAGADRAGGDRSSSYSAMSDLDHRFRHRHCRRGCRRPPPSRRRRRRSPDDASSRPAGVGVIATSGDGRRADRRRPGRAGQGQQLAGAGVDRQPAASSFPARADELAHGDRADRRLGRIDRASSHPPMPAGAGAPISPSMSFATTSSAASVTDRFDQALQISTPPCPKPTSRRPSGNPAPHARRQGALRVGPRRLRRPAPQRRGFARQADSR